MYHPERLWGVAFVAVTIGFVIDTYLIIKGIHRKRMGIYDVLVSLGVPCLILLMLTDEKLTMGAKIIESIIGFVCLVSGIGHIYALRRKIPPSNKKE